MMLAALLTILAAATSAQSPGREAALGVTATVVRPVEISPPSISADGAVLTIRNTAGVEVLAAGGSVGHPGQDTVIVTGDRSGSLAITIVH